MLAMHFLYFTLLLQYRDVLSCLSRASQSHKKEQKRTEKPDAL